MSRPILSAHASVVASRLLGAQLVSTVDSVRVAVRITEVEAYGGEGEDPGSHAFRGQTPRNAMMFGPSGHAYIYFTYGMHWCCNVVTGEEGRASAVLLRAGEIVDGLDTARLRRSASAKADRDLARGPARLSVALGITGDLNGVDLTHPESDLRLRLGRSRLTPHVVGPRTGVAGEGALVPWRFALNDPTVSPYRAAKQRSTP